MAKIVSAKNILRYYCIRQKFNIGESNIWQHEPLGGLNNKFNTLLPKFNTLSYTTGHNFLMMSLLCNALNIAETNILCAQLFKSHKSF